MQREKRHNERRASPIFTAPLEVSLDLDLVANTNCDPTCFLSFGSLTVLSLNPRLDYTLQGNFSGDLDGEVDDYIDIFVQKKKKHDTMKIARCGIPQCHPLAECFVLEDPPLTKHHSLELSYTIGNATQNCTGGEGAGIPLEGFFTLSSEKKPMVRKHKKQKRNVHGKRVFEF